MTLEDDILSRALRESRDRELAQLPEASKEAHSFSEKFEREMGLLIRDEKRSPRRRLQAASRRAAVIAVVGLVGLSTCIMSVDAWREKLFEMVEEKFPEYSSISYAPVAGGGADALPSFDLVEFRPAYLPEGYMLVQQMLNTTINWSFYEDGEGGSFSFDQSVLGTVGSSINTEGSTLEQFEMQNGDTAYKMSNHGAQFVLWNDNQYEYKVIAQGIPLEEAVKIAESTALSPADAPHPPQLESQCSDLPEVYPIGEAAGNGDVAVAENGARIENLAVLDRWFNDYEQGKQAVAMLVNYDKGTPLTQELYFNGFEVVVTTDETRLLENPGEGTNTKHYEKISREKSDGGIVVVLTGKDGEKTELLRYAARD